MEALNGENWSKNTSEVHFEYEKKMRGQKNASKDRKRVSLLITPFRLKKRKSMNLNGIFHFLYIDNF